MHDDDLSAPAAAAGAGGVSSSRVAAGDTSRSRDGVADGRRRSGGVYAGTQAAVQAVAAGAVCVLQQLAVPWGGLLDQEGICNSQGMYKE
jgi:hypothetical protein